jgi:large subunit ribosomal protein L20
MPRVKRGVTAHNRHKNLLARTKGFRNGRRTQVRRATEASLHAGQFAYRDRRNKKRDLRRAWIVRINAAVRPHGLSYSTFIAKLKDHDAQVNRKILSDMALTDAPALEALIRTIAK